jgi:hypothetical protein
VKYKTDIPRPLSIISDKVLIPLRSLLLGVAREHALQAYTHAFNIVDGGPTGAVKQVEADDAVGVDVWVPGYGAGFGAEEDYFGGLGCDVRQEDKGMESGRRTSIGYWGVKLNFNRYVSPWYSGFESMT